MPHLEQNVVIAGQDVAVCYHVMVKTERVGIDDIRAQHDFIGTGVDFTVL